MVNDTMTKNIRDWHAPYGVYCKKYPGVETYGCAGCRTSKGKILKFPICKTYECVTSKNYEFCYECEESPCEMLQPIVNFEIFTPHNSKVYNLVMMKKLGLDKWNKICDDKTVLYYRGKKIRYGGDKLTFEEKDPNMYKKRVTKNENK
jgi:hypothetical protein